MEDGQCTWAVSDQALPVQLRRYTDYLWQRDPFKLGRGAYMEGWRQYAGTDFTQPYWNARRYDLISEGDGLVLAWRPDGVCEPSDNEGGSVE